MRLLGLGLGLTAWRHLALEESVHVTVTPTVTPTLTPTVTPTLTPTLTPTNTPSVTPTLTTTPTVTPTKSVTPTISITPTVTITPSAITGYIVSTFVGLSGNPGSTDGNNTVATFNDPQGFAIDTSDNNIFVATGTGIRQITPAGIVSTIVNTNTAGTYVNICMTVSGGTNLLYGTCVNSKIIRTITVTGDQTTVAGLSGTSGTADGSLTDSRFTSPRGIAQDTNGDFFICDSNQIRKIDASTGTVSTFAGSTTSGYTNGTGTAARFNAIVDICIDSNNNLYVSDFTNNAIRKITSAGEVTTFAGSDTGTAGSTDGTGTDAKFRLPQGISIDSNDTIYVADRGNNKIRKITSAGVVTSIGSGTSGCINGPASTARFNSPASIIAVSPTLLYVSEIGNDVIRKIIFV